MQSTLLALVVLEIVRPAVMEIGYIYIVVNVNSFAPVGVNGISVQIRLLQVLRVL